MSEKFAKNVQNWHKDMRQEREDLFYGNLRNDKIGEKLVQIWWRDGQKFIVNVMYSFKAVSSGHSKLLGKWTYFVNTS